MAQCTAPIRGHRTESGRLNCPVCGRYGTSGSYFYRLTSYPYPIITTTNTTDSTRVRNTNHNTKRKAKWSPQGSSVLYTPSEIRTLTPVRKNIVQQSKSIEKFDLFLCHAWDDRKGAAKELYEKLKARGVTIWFSENNLQLGTTMLREIDKGLAKSYAGIVLVTPAFLKRIENEGVAEKELSALLAKDLLIPIVHGTTYEDLRNVSPLLGSRSGLDTGEDSMDEVADKLAELFVEEAY